MKKRPTLETERLILRPFESSDAGAVQRFAGDRTIADTTLAIPHPYEGGMAEEWISSHEQGFDSGEHVAFAIVNTQTNQLVGAVSLDDISPCHRRAELGYWIGTPYWTKGYCTEAVRAVVDYGFRVLNLNRIQGRCLKRNPASGRVMQKLGLTREGCLRQYVKKWDEMEDVYVFGILRSEWETACS